MAEITEQEAEAALAEAIQAYASAVSGITVTDWMVILVGKSIEQIENGKSQYIGVSPDGQEFHAALGLATYLLRSVEDSQGDDDAD